jgi:hypothetical protein
MDLLEKSDVAQADRLSVKKRMILNMQTNGIDKIGSFL